MGQNTARDTAHLFARAAKAKNARKKGRAACYSSPALCVFLI
jgi:hypothetical protein